MKDDFTLEDILEEERQKREARAGGQPTEEAPVIEYVPEEPGEEYVPEEQGYEPEEYAPDPGPEYAPEDPGPEYVIEEQGSEAPEPERGKKKKKKRWGLFGRKKVPDFDESEEDIYYGIQLKPIDEYRMDGDAPPLGEEGYKALFDDSKTIDDQVEENFQRLQKERRRRVAEAVQSAGLDQQQVEEEFGVVAPVPLTSYAADPYARQHGLETEGQELSDLQKALLSTDQTMEIKLNVLNSTIELQKLQDGQPVSEETVERILREAPEPPEEYVEREHAPEPEPAAEYVEREYAPEPEPAAEYVEREYAPEPEPVAEYVEREYAPEPEPVAEYVEREYAPEPEPVAEYVEREYAPEPEPVAEYVEREYAPEPEPEPQPPAPAELKTIEIPVAKQEPAPGPAPEQEPPPRPIQQVPYVETVYQYRSRSIATHIINADLLHSALLSETESLQRERDALEGRQAPRRRIKPRKTMEPEPPEPELPREDSNESIEDYTGPEDARSISSEIKGQMGKFSLTMMITGVCTLLLAVVSLVCRNNFTPKGTTWPLAYVVLTLIFLVVSAGISYKTVGRGLKGLFAAQANADSGVAVATVAALVQTVASVFFRSQLDGLYLYAPVVSALLFMNSAGKLTMLRRIHSNFRFVTSREQKYAVRTYEDYNTSLKMAKDCVAEKPLIAYQCRAGFLKRFLELSYSPDPSETSSQLLAPLGLISSLVLCIACLLITKDVPTSIGALAAACCACVAAGNMLTVNLPVSNLCKTVRRAGGMIVGHVAVEAFGDVNAVIADAGELFPTGTVVISGIKQFGSQVVAEDAIMCATALVKEAGGPLLGVFEQVISDTEDMLPGVERISYESGAGLVGRVDGRTVYIGNRALLTNHRLEAPPRELEVQYSSGGKDVLYLAVDSEVAAMLVLTYSADRRKKNELQRLEDSGISVLVRTADPNVTVAQVSRLFGVDPASIGILDGQLGDTARQLLESDPPRADALAATKGRMESMMSLIAACVEQKRTTGMLVAIQSAAVILGFVLVAFMSCFGEIRQVSSFLLFAFQMFWTALLLVLPRFRR
ncbi:hypothetical protein [Acutalibacter muris]|uniref:hypothetical protein n=1 Tax=Acutalibacter muris TaxID=1796620 RepID=UPI001C3EA48D|nr:hypothetical protein [Acutalibacter muris]